MTKQLKEVINIPTASDVVKFHKKQIKLSQLKNATKSEAEALEMFKLMHSRPQTDGMIGKEIRQFLEPNERKKLSEIHMRFIDMYMIYYKMKGVSDLKSFDGVVLNELNEHRRKRIVGVIKNLDSLISKFGIPIEPLLNDFHLYRIMSNPYEIVRGKGQIPAFSSWSVYPLSQFCSPYNKCYVYIVSRADHPIKILYIDQPNQQLSNWEFEFVLPRGIVFKVIHSFETKIEDPNFQHRGIPTLKKTGIITIHVSYISIIDQVPASVDKIKFPPITKIGYGG